MIKRNSKIINVHSITQQLSLKFGACQKWEPAGRIGDFGNCFNFFVKSPLLPLLHIQLTISFLIGRTRTVNFRNQRLGHHLAADYTIIMSTTLKVKGNHVMYDRGAWFLRVIMSSSRALCCLPSVKKQKHDFQVFFVDLARHRKSSWRQGLTNTKRSTKVAKELFADYVKETNWENLWYFFTFRDKLKLSVPLTVVTIFCFSFNV